MNSVTPISEASAELAQILDAYLAAREAGRHPDKQQLLADHPEFADELQDCLASLEFIGTAVSPAVEREAGVDDADSVAPSAEPIGDFRLIREIGRGGMGVVYEAIQLSLARRVALKVLPFAAVLDPAQVRRFKNEAQSAASLDHPHIVSVYSVGCERGIHYYAMQYVEGQSLDCVGGDRGTGSNEVGGDTADTAPIAALSTLGGRDARERFRHVARLGIQAADALHYAHEMGIVHRDIKPSNLLVDAHSELWITDFGLATTQSDAGLTMTGDLLGTLRYMSPEQAAGHRAKIDYRTDVYSLGITLYELATGRPAFADTDRQALLRHILEQDPVSPSSIDPAIPRDLEAIVLKATAKEPQARYDSAAEFAADLQRFCENKPIRARRTSRAERVWRWSLRNRTVAALSLVVATLVLLVAVTAPLIAWQQARLVKETRQQLYVKDLSIAYNAWNDGDLAHARGLLDRYASGSHYARLRDFPWYYLDGLYRRTTAGFMTGERFAVSPSAQLLAVARSDDRIHLYDARSWNEVGTLPWKYQALVDFRLSPDGRYLLSTYLNGMASIWDVVVRKHLYTIVVDRPFGTVTSPRFSPDGSVLASGGSDRDVKVWEVATGKLLRELKGHRDAVTALAFSPDGKTLASGSNDYSLRYWDTDTWQPREVIENAFTARVFAFAFDPTGSRLAAGGLEPRVTIWSASGRQLASLPMSSYIWSLCYSPDGELLAVGSSLKGAVAVWDDKEENLIQEFVLGSDRVSSVAFLPSGELLIDACGKLFRRDVDERAERSADEAPEVQTEEISIDVSAGGDVMVAGYGRYQANPGEGAVACWDLRRGKHRLLPGHDGSSVFDVAIDPTGELIVAGGGPRYGPGFVKLWNARTGTLVAELPKEETDVIGVALSPTDNRLATAVFGRVAVWTSLITHPEPLWSRNVREPLRVAFSPDGDAIAVGVFSNNGDWTKKNVPTVMIYDAETGEQLETASFDRAIMELAFSPDSRFLASIDWDGRVEIYDRRDHRSVLSERAHPIVGYSVAFSPDGQTLATASASGDVKFWHLPTMMLVTTLKTRGRVAELKFFPDGRTLAVGYLDRTIELWHVDAETELLRIDDPADQSMEASRENNQANAL